MNRAKVITAKFIAPTVRWLRLRTDIENRDQLRFKAGQWLDLFVPESSHIGGFSMCSSPSEYTQNGTFDLAVKHSDHPAVEWVHSKCDIGTEITYSFGGEIYYDETSLRPLILIAGGIGINPMLSILQRAAEISDAPAELFYSAKTAKDLIFKDEIDNLIERKKNLDVNYFLTSEDDARYSRGRIDDTTLQKSVEKLKADKLQAFICGPTNMIKDLRTTLHNMGVPESRIRYELWE